MTDYFKTPVITPLCAGLPGSCAAVRRPGEGAAKRGAFCGAAHCDGGDRRAARQPHRAGLAAHAPAGQGRRKTRRGFLALQYSDALAWTDTCCSWCATAYCSLSGFESRKTVSPNVPGALACFCCNMTLNPLMCSSFSRILKTDILSNHCISRISLQALLNEVVSLESARA